MHAWSGITDVNVLEFMHRHGLATRVESAVRTQVGEEAGRALIEAIAPVPVRKSHALRRLGSYSMRDGKPVAIRLQFAVEQEVLVETFLHELAHLCDHLVTQSGQRCSRVHGQSWQHWATAFGIDAKRCGESRVLEELRKKRLKVVAVCSRCGTEIRRLRRLDSGKRYLHPDCGGRIRPV